MAPAGGRAPALLLTSQRLLAVCAIVLLCLGTPSSAQSPAAGATPYDTAVRAFNVGRFDEVDGVLRGATDARSLALRARALVARGRYDEAEKLLTAPAAANPGSDAALELGLLQKALGRRAEARATLNRLVESAGSSSADDVLRAAVASHALGEFRQANDFFRDADRLRPNDPVINTRWGELFLETSEAAESQKSFQIALKADANAVPAMVGLARALLETNPPAARTTIERALKINPGYVPAHVLTAELALDDRKRDEAREAVGKALAVNPNDLDARALSAAIDRLEDQTAKFDAAVAAILAINPRFGEVYRVAGDHLARNYRFDEAVALIRRALEIDPDNTTAYADLGVNLLRTGDEAEARRALETAFTRNPYYSNLVTRNLLEMLDELAKFETIRDGNVVMRLHPEEAAVMREFALPLAQEALATLAKQYQFEVREPILVEMFPKHDDFAVRTLGLPGMVGALGACFGRVVTLDSPRARRPGEFSWEGTLWHEIAHVITLQMSNNRLPRWLSEGISQFEERRRRPEWGREMEVSFAQALEEGKTLKLADLNEGFSDPKLISLTYYQASLVVEHIIATHGEPALRELLRAYGRGLENEAAIKAALGVSLDQLQATFDAKLERDFRAVRAALQAPEIPENPSLEQLKTLAASHPGSFRVQMQLGLALQEAGDSAGAIQALERAAQLLPQANGEANPHAMIASIAAERGDSARAIQALQAVLKVDYADVESARRLAALQEKQGDAAGALATHAIVASLDPFDATSQGHVGRAALQRGDAPRAIRSLRAALAANPSDRAGAHIDLAEAYFAAGHLDDAKRQALSALEIAPSFERAQDLLLKIVDAQPGGRGGAD